MEDSEANKSNPCTKESVIAALRERRKRGVEDKDDGSSTASTPWEKESKRRYLLPPISPNKHEYENKSKQTCLNQIHAQKVSSTSSLH